MQLSNEVIEILEYLCEKIGITIDWTNANIFPLLEQICEKFIKWEIATSIMWIVIFIVATIIATICLKKCDLDGFEYVLFVSTAIIAFIGIGTQAFDIIECCVFPEKTIYDFISYQINIMN